jgi:hypothetical protein
MYRVGLPFDNILLGAGGNNGNEKFLIDAHTPLFLLKIYQFQSALKIIQKII